MDQHAAMHGILGSPEVHRHSVLYDPIPLRKEEENRVHYAYGACVLQASPRALSIESPCSLLVVSLRTSCFPFAVTSCVARAAAMALIA